ncbi:hypothetical protein Noc_2433 [Nitrosococcus oceani ATCC 19707]|uniref:TPR repeat protein n=2 Tax=Nitrosococcus oceani TaxID=1229 RepID=Q3J8F7_NITOC|nr:hypothetical protein [Nitrosococcus oceani]ABA58889.1 hypothetical protein Noc_2433 [Nitrosococcus oceani ATCC 19707]EDZ67733.1 hypothetical protein NOC27_1060 [Nitrosococcus oceani AFC27]KFI18688.1 hypothetical protein IB75_12950 [Nitrosococcus oceani C-27]GEM19018.1 hypothetical protein NONS58_03860 [Nitrosococcus oceani]
MKKIKRWLARNELARGKLQAQKARETLDSKADDFFKNAYKKLSSAALLDSDNGGILHYWGLVLYDQAQRKQGREAKELYQAAGEKFEKALNLEPDNAKIMNDWGAALIEQARNKPDKRAESFYEEAKEKITAADALEPGLGAYNLACIHSLRREQKACQKYLEQAHLAGNLPSIKYLKVDQDLDNVKSEKWFQDFLEKISEETEKNLEIEEKEVEAEIPPKNQPEGKRKNGFSSWWRKLRRS